jgi:RNA polymerase sigma-70 factor (ECF subfamily)
VHRQHCLQLDQDVAREVVQEVFLVAFESLPDFRGRSFIKTWLFGIAFKKCLEVERNRKCREALVYNAGGDAVS